MRFEHIQDTMAIDKSQCYGTQKIIMRTAGRSGHWGGMVSISPLIYKAEKVLHEQECHQNSASLRCCPFLSQLRDAWDRDRHFLQWCRHCVLYTLLKMTSRIRGMWHLFTKSRTELERLCRPLSETIFELPILFW